MNDDQIMRMAENRIRSQLAKAARRLASEAESRLTSKTGEPSEPGEYPAKQTGELANSIRVDESREGDTFEARVSLTADHAKYLAGSRKLIGSAAEEIRPELERIMAGN